MKGLKQEPSNPVHQQLITTALALAKRTRRPMQSDLRRAVSTAYYAMFHALCEVCANSLVGTKTPDRPERAWAQTYRALNHRPSAAACKKISEFSFPKQIQEFADYYVTMQEHRHRADYDPQAKFRRKEVIEYIEGARKAIETLNNVAAKHKRAFSALVLFNKR